jgi:hypothetical protein
MRIAFKMSGGLAAFPGLQKEHVVDTSQLEPGHAAELEALVAAADLFKSAPAARALPDARTYLLTIEHEGQQQKAQLTDPIVSREAAALISALQRAVRSQAR